jgi:enoyl-CoA hydratase/carnithine racemase
MDLGVYLPNIVPEPLDRALLPWIVASQTVPVLAIAPIVLVILGSLGFAGIAPKAAIAMYLCFFPVTVAMVQGAGVAGGCELALHCDLRVAADSARFSMPLARIGLAVPVTLTWKLVDTIGAAKTNELLFTGEAVAAESACSLGLVNRVVPADELDSAVASLAHQIIQNAPLSVRAMKAFVQRATSLHRMLARDDPFAAVTCHSSSVT